jgi:hypothetical protein
MVPTWTLPAGRVTFSRASTAATSSNTSPYAPSRAGSSRMLICRSSPPNKLTDPTPGRRASGSATWFSMVSLSVSMLSRAVMP